MSSIITSSKFVDLVDRIIIYSSHGGNMKLKLLKILIIFFYIFYIKTIMREIKNSVITVFMEFTGFTRFMRLLEKIFRDTNWIIRFTDYSNFFSCLVQT